MLLNPDLAKLLLRLCVGGLMLFHGIFKITHGADMYVGMLESKGLPGLMAYGVYIWRGVSTAFDYFGLSSADCGFDCGFYNVYGNLFGVWI